MWFSNHAQVHVWIFLVSEKSINICASAWDFQQCVMCDQQSLRSDCARAFARRLSILWLLKTYAAISNAHLSRVWKRVKLSGSCLSTINGFGSTQLFRHFLDTIKQLKCVRNIYWLLIRTDRLSTDKCSSVNFKRRTQFPWLRIRQWSNLHYLYGYLERRTTWPRGLVVSVSGYEARGPGSIPWCAHIFSVFFTFFFNI